MILECFFWERSGFEKRQPLCPEESRDHYQGAMYSWLAAEELIFYSLGYPSKAFFNLALENLFII